MKKEFFAYLRPSKSEFAEMWNNCIFSFDANILLNFYRYTPETTNEFLELFERLKDRIHVTYQASQEYFINRLDVITEQRKAYSDVRDALLKSVEEPLQTQRKHPYINDDLLNEFKGIADKIKIELNNRSKEYAQKITNDDILDRLVEIFDDKVGDQFTDARLIEIYEDGDIRYNKISPGFKDKHKGGVRQYGDLVLWHQIISISKKFDRDLIFITDDVKEDWLHIHKGKTIGPLPELQMEFNGITNRKFYMYTASKFVELASEYLNTVVNEQTIEEVRNLREENQQQVTEEEDFADDFLTEEEIDNYLTAGVKLLKNETGWTELAPLGLYLLRNTPINYRQFGFPSLKRFIESRSIFDMTIVQKSPNAKAVDSAFVKLKSPTLN